MKFKGRSFCVSDDLNLDEKQYLFDNVKLFKKAEGTDLERKFKISEEFSSFGIYNVFLENSTRTDHSNRNVAGFHGVKFNVLDRNTSSFHKGESYVDGINNLIGYRNHLFNVRSELEGTCTWLKQGCGEYCLRNGLDLVSFINCGDGKHEHPTQDLLDIYTFWEDSDFDNSHIHIALVGDLKHGRTVHSKAEGLKFFKEVEVDLISPEMMKMPKSYINRMKENGFKIREFKSLDDYFSQNHLADKLYATRLQLERMGPDVLQMEKQLRKDVTFYREFDGLKKISHPLPRKKECPVIPIWLDNTPHNLWDLQSANGYAVRVVLTSMLAGKIGGDYEGPLTQKREFLDDFIEEVQPNSRNKNIQSGIKPIKNGVCIDKICYGSDDDIIGNYLEKVMAIMNFRGKRFSGVDKSITTGQYKGFIFLPDRKELTEEQKKKLAAIAPCTYNFIQDHTIVRKQRLNEPPRIYNFDEISCKNKNCISYPEHHEGVTSEFWKDGEFYTCKYCETPHTFREIWE